MSNLSKGINMFLLSILIMALLITIMLGFMLGFSHPLPWILIGFLIVIPYIHEKIIAKRYIKWDKSMSVGIDMIDKDHQKLLALINQLQTATHYNVDKQMISDVMHELISYTQYHFNREETLMRINHYPGYENHQQLHHAMIKNMNECMDKYKHDPDHSVDQALAFLKNWLINHIMGSDKDYVPYIKTTDLTQESNA